MTAAKYVIATVAGELEMKTMTFKQFYRLNPIITPTRKKQFADVQKWFDEEFPESPKLAELRARHEARLREGNGTLDD